MNKISPPRSTGMGRIVATVFRILEVMLKHLLIMLAAFMILFTALQVLNRFIFSRSIIWIEEITKYLFIWLVMLGLALGAKDDRHFRMKELFARLPRSVQERANKIISVLILGLLGLLFASSLILIGKTVGQVELTTGIPMVWFYASISAGSLMTFLFYLRRLFHTSPGRPGGEADEPVAGRGDEQGESV